MPSFVLLRGRSIVAAAALILLAAGAGWSLGRRPGGGDAPVVAEIRGGPLAPQLAGRLELRPADGGTLVTVRLRGLPAYEPGPPPIGPHGFHLHEHGTCDVGDPDDPFLAAGGHWNPDGQPHGNHAGDFPVVFSQRGTAWMQFITYRFRPQDAVGKAVIIHQNPDDYRSQPAGNSGRRLGCGVVTRR